MCNVLPKFNNFSFSLSFEFEIVKDLWEWKLRMFLSCKNVLKMHSIISFEARTFFRILTERKSIAVQAYITSGSLIAQELHS